MAEPTQYDDTSIFSTIGNYLSQKAQANTTEDPTPTDTPDAPVSPDEPSVDYGSRIDELEQLVRSLQDQRTPDSQDQDNERFMNTIFGNTDPTQPIDFSTMPPPAPTYSNSGSSSGGILNGILGNEGGKTGQGNAHSSSIGRGQIIRGTREAMYKKMGITDIAAAEQAYKTNPQFEDQVINAYKGELDARIPQSIQGAQRDYMIAKGWYTGNPNYPDNKVPHPEAGNRLTAGQYADRALNRRQNGGDVSQMGYRSDSPYQDQPYLDIHSPEGLIDMSHTNIPLYAEDNTGFAKYLPPNSGMHKFPGTNVRETRMQNGGVQRGGLHMVNDTPEEIYNYNNHIAGYSQQLGPNYIGTNKNNAKYKNDFYRAANGDTKGVSKTIINDVQKQRILIGDRENYDQTNNLQQFYFSDPESLWQPSLPNVEIPYAPTSYKTGGENITKKEAAKLLKQGTIRGKKISDKQRKFFAATAFSKK